MKLTPTILAGGYGTRLWPLSRQALPKQFLKLTSELSMLQETLSRLSGVEIEKPHVICNHEHRFLVAEQLREIDIAADIILEPAARNTAPAIALSALTHTDLGTPSDIMLVLPADHHIGNAEAFQKAIQAALPFAESGKLVTFGVTPLAPATQYGYIKTTTKANQNVATPVECFIEKPDADTARYYLESGDYLWNSGIFMFRADVYLNELQRYAPDIYAHCGDAVQQAWADLDFIRIDDTHFSNCPSDSIDYAVMEKTEHAVVIPMDADWSDVGSWSTLYEVMPQDASGNAIQGDVVIENSRDCLIVGDERLVSILGVEDLVVVDTKDALLVSHKSKTQQVKMIVDQLKKAERTEHLHHQTVYRPWGKYSLIDCGDAFKVKHITVNPDAKLSLQKHHHRAEHWIVVSGVAQVRCGEKTMSLSANQSTYIPQGEIHQLENLEKEPLEMIEVQSGSYLGEDDIVRYEDDYGRHKP